MLAASSHDHLFNTTSLTGLGKVDGPKLCLHAPFPPLEGKTLLPPSPNVKRKKPFLYLQFGFFVKIKDPSFEVVHLGQNKSMVYIITSLQTDE